MSIRHVAKTLAVSGAATLCGATLVVGLGAGAAGAGQVSSPTLTNGPTTLTANGTSTVAAGTPYSSGQAITVSGSANSTLNAANLAANSIGAGNYYIIECADPGGTTVNLPSQPNNCEGGNRGRTHLAAFKRRLVHRFGIPGVRSS